MIFGRDPFLDVFANGVFLDFSIFRNFAANMRYNSGYNREGDYDHYVVNEPMPLLEWLLANVQQTKTKIKATLQGRGIKVNGKTVSQFDFPLEPGMKVAVSKTKRNQQGFKSRYVKIVYEDKWLIVIEKAVGILSMAAGHSTLNVKTVLDDYFKKSRQKCTAHVVHRLDRDTSGLMVYAKDMETEQILEHNWHDIVYDRRYVAVCSGEMEQDEGTIENWLKDNKAYITYSSPVDNGGKYAVTHFHVMARTTEHSLVEFKLETGERIRFVSTRPIWGILSAATPNTVMVTIPCIVSVCMPGCSVSIIPSRASRWSLRHPYPQNSEKCSNNGILYFCSGRTDCRLHRGEEGGLVYD